MAKSKNPTGRPTIMTPDVIKRLEDAFAMGCTDAEACLYADIATETLYKYQVRVPAFVQRKDALKQKPILLARQSVLKGFAADHNLALKYLERKLPKEFAMRRELTGADGKDLLPTPILGGVSLQKEQEDAQE